MSVVAVQLAFEHGHPRIGFSLALKGACHDNKDNYQSPGAIV